MKTIVKFPDRSLLSEEAAEWLIRLDADAPPTEEDLRALGEWLHRSPAHREELESLAALWGRMNVLTELAVPLERASMPPVGKGPERQAVLERSSRRPVRWAALAAGPFLVAVAIGFTLLMRGPEADRYFESNGLYATAVGQQKATTLADGSEVILNTNSQMRVSYDADSRDIYLLQGEALFTVARNAERPFRVYAGDGRIEALGTAFSVYLNGEDVNVTVTEGRIALASMRVSRSKDYQPSASLPQPPEVEGSSFDRENDLIESLGTLTAGQVATIRSAAAEEAAGAIGALEVSEPIAPDKLAERLAWREGILLFSGDTLEEVVNEVSRYTTVSIEIPDASVRSMRIGGRFPVGQTEVMLAALETNFNLRVTHLGHDRVVISAAGE